MTKNKKILFFATIAFQVLFLLAMLYSKHSVVANGKKIFLKTYPIDPRSPLRGQYVALKYDFSQINLADDSDIEKGNLVYVILEKDGKFYRYKDIKREIPKDLKANEVFITGKVKYPSRKDRVFLGKVTSSEKDSDWFKRNKENIDIPEKIISYNGKFKKGKKYYFIIDQVPQREGEWRVNTYSGNEDLKALEKQYHYKKNLKTVSYVVQDVETVVNATALYGIESFFVEEGKGYEIEKHREKGDVYVKVAVSDDGEAVLTSLFVGDKEYK